MLVSMCAVSAVAIAGQAAPPVTPSAAQPDAHVGVIARAVVRDICGKQVVLLGESPTHGFGKTMKFKAELIRALVDGCHFNAVFFESGIYDFLNIQTGITSGGKVDGDAVAAAIGGLWANRDVEPLVAFLLDKVRGGQLVIGGIDDQINRGTWAQHQMAADLVQYLAGDEKPRCLGILQRHLLWQYRGDAPYGPKDKALIVGCLDEIERTIGQERAAGLPSREVHLAMVASVRRSFARDFTQDLPGVDSDTRLFNARDASMYQNFRWLVSQLPAGSKVIVWTATTHAAKDLRSAPGFESFVPLGKRLQDDYGARSFALLISAASGSYARARQPIQQLSPAPEGSLERRAFAGVGDARYYGRNELHELGAIAGRALGTGFKTARWDELCDGLVIFREERPPEPSK
jgi:erythromycin esterase-like protein